MSPAEPFPDAPSDFIRDIIDEDLRTGKHRTVVSRFPPEPNGYLHIGHAKSICLNFGVARQYGGRCHLRMDDTDPTKEDVEYVESMQRDVRWLGFDWGEDMYFASDYFEKLYAYAEQLIRDGKAYVDSLNEEEMREYRGTILAPGRRSRFAERSVEENLDLFRRMRAGDFPDGAHVLRARIDMSSPNMKMRDPAIYRIRHVEHYRQGKNWCIYPLYDFTHCLSDSIEGITHSLCTLEFENNRELYDWFLDELAVDCHPQQIEFARLNLTYTMMSKRRLLALVQEKRVSGWDDPRMPTLAGLRRRGYTAQAIRAFCERIGISKNNSTVELELLEHCVRDDLNQRSARVLCVLRPLKLTITSYPEHQVEELDAPYFPEDVGRAGSRTLPFCRDLLIERDDFQKQPPKGWHRLAPGARVRLRHGYVVKCVDVVEDERGEVVELKCTHDPDTRDAPPKDGRRIKGTLHWVSARHAIRAEVRLYDRLFSDPAPDAADDFRTVLNPESLTVVGDALIEPSVASAQPGDHFQFERLGFFAVDPDSRSTRPVFNRTVSLRDSWAKLQARPAAAAGAVRPAEPAQRKPAAAPIAPKAELGADARRLAERWSMSAEEAKSLADDAALASLFENAAEGAAPATAKALASLVVNELRRELHGRSPAALPFGAAELAELAALVADGTLGATLAKDVLVEMVATGAKPRAIVERKGLRQMGDASEIRPVVDRVLADNPDLVSRYRAGNPNLFGALVGQVMKATRGKANPKLVNELLREQLGS
jgi:glutaminyl-tRNA synthetase